MAEGLDSQVSSATEAVRKLPELVEAAIELFGTQTGVVIILALAGWLVFRLLSSNWLQFLELVERKSTQRIAALDRYVSAADSSDPVCVEVLRDMRDAYYFQSATGIYAERAARQALLELHRISPTVITWQRIGRAAQHLHYPNRGPAEVVKFSWLEYAFHWYTLVTAWAATLGGVLMALMILLIRPMSLTAGIFGFAVSAGSFALGIYMFTQRVPMVAAQRIKREVAFRAAPPQQEVQAVHVNQPARGAEAMPATPPSLRPVPSAQSVASNLSPPT